MTKEELAKGWAHAQILANLIWEAYVFEVAVEKAKKAQQSLKIWLDLMREFGYVYNGELDEFVNLRL